MLASLAETVKGRGSSREYLGGILAGNPLDRRRRLPPDAEIVPIQESNRPVAAADEPSRTKRVDGNAYRGLEVAGVPVV